jgi:hypothetical protein
MFLVELSFREDEINVGVQSGVDESLTSKGKDKKVKSK